MIHIVSPTDIALARWIRPGDGVIWGQATAEPQTLVEAMIAQRAEYSGARAFMGVSYSGIVRPEHADHLRLSAYCGAGANRALADAGVLDICPYPYSQLATLIRHGHIRADVVMIQVSPQNARGEHSLGMAAEYLVPAIQCARVVLAEINDQVPWTHCERVLRAEDISLAVETSRPVASAPRAVPGEIERGIAAHAARFVPDGATLEFGLGALPDAVLAELGDRRDLGVHSGALGDSIVDLMRRGVINNARKPIDAGRSVGGLLLGSQRLFEFAHQNPALWLRSVEHTHDPRILAQLPNFVAINSAVQVDLTGQVNAEVANGSYVGAVGGALDFVRAANQSTGGASLIVLPSSVAGKLSRVVAQLSGPVTTPRSEAGVIVTEHGFADLRGKTLAQRARLMINIALPAFRDDLERLARDSGLLRD
jgi:acyl-CoA hydrolase